EHLRYSHEITLRSHVLRNEKTELDKLLTDDCPEVMLYGFARDDGEIIAYTVLDCRSLAELIRQRPQHLRERTNKDGTRFMAVEIAKYAEAVIQPLTFIGGIDGSVNVRGDRSA